MNTGVELARRVRQFATNARAVLRRVLGVPDYDAYVRHFAVANPGVTPPSRTEFELSRLEARYSRPGAKCC